MKFCTECYTTTRDVAMVCPVLGCHGTLRHEPLLESLIDGRYTPEAVHCAGGMGVLFRARHIHLNTLFAIKVLDFQRIGEQNAAAATDRFRQEATLVARLRHPNIVEVSDFGTTPDGRTFIVMEFLEGHDLDFEIVERGPLSPARISEVIRPVCEALAWTHRHSVVHRDIKPANIMLSRIGGEEQVKLLDFGVAKMMEPASSPDQAPVTMVVGTPEYMAPEQIRPWAATMGAATDVYALAVTVYEMATCETPFRHHSLAHIIQSKMACRFTPLAQRRPGEGWEAVDLVVRQAISIEPEDRQGSALLFLEELEVALSEVRTEVEAPATTSSSSSPYIDLPGLSTPSNLSQTSGLSDTMPSFEQLIEGSVELRVCPACAASLPEGALFCPYCGSGTPVTPSDPFLGAVVDDTYRLDKRVRRHQEPIGYRAVNLRLDQEVEIRLTATGCDGSSGLAERIREEARLGGRLAHSGLTATLDGGFDPALGVAYVVTEWLEGPTLSEALAQEKPPGLERLRRWLLALLDTLSFLHSRGLVYQALQPDTIKLVRRGGSEEMPVLVDLHCARGGSDFSRMLTLGRLGAPHFMSPEQLWFPERIDQRTDLYGVGALAYLCLTGQPPFAGDDAREVLARMRAGRLVSPRLKSPDRVSPSWEALVLRAMAHNPDERFASVEEMVAEVGHAM
jgi:serine/threonine protein kinase